MLLPGISSNGKALAQSLESLRVYMEGLESKYLVKPSRLVAASKLLAYHVPTYQQGWTL